jgi:transcriptional regulator with XRE-family HTH domain
MGTRIRQVREDDLQEEFAAYIGVSQGQLSKIENGKMAPALETLVRIAARAERSLDWIVWGD